MKTTKLVSLTLCALMATAAWNVSAAAENDNDILVGVPQISVDGEVIDFKKSGLSQTLFEENGKAMVPMRAVAEKMGFMVGWDGENRSVTVGSDTWEVRAFIGEDLYSGVTKIEGAVGMTAPQSYGAAPIISENTTYVPAEMFEMMGYGKVTVGQFVDFRKIGTLVDENGQEYSNNTLIITVSADADKDEINALLEANRLSVLYDMDTLNMVAVKLSAPMTAKEMDALMAELEKNENVLAVSKDYILHLDDPAQSAT